MITKFDDFEKELIELNNKEKMMYKSASELINKIFNKYKIDFIPITESDITFSLNNEHIMPLSMERKNKSIIVYFSNIEGDEFNKDINDLTLDGINDLLNHIKIFENDVNTLVHDLKFTYRKKSIDDMFRILYTFDVTEFETKYVSFDYCIQKFNEYEFQDWYLEKIGSDAVKDIKDNKKVHFLPEIEEKYKTLIFGTRFNTM